MNLTDALKNRYLRGKSGFYSEKEKTAGLVQLGLTLIILAYIPSSLIQVLILPVIWFLFWGRLSRAETVLFVSGCILFTVMDIAAVHQGLLYFSSADIFGIPLFETVMWGFYLVHAERMTGTFPHRGNLILLLCSAGLFASVFIFIKDYTLLFYAASGVVCASFLFFHKKADFIHAGYMAVLGLAVEYTGVKSGLWAYPGHASVPLWSLPMWAGVGLLSGRIASCIQTRVKNGKRVKGPDILLVNSFNPRRRSLSDPFLDNGLATIRAYLEERGFRTETEDSTTIGRIDRFSPAVITRVLRRNAVAVLEARRQGRNARIRKLIFAALQYILDAFHRIRSGLYIQNIIRRVEQQGIPVAGVKVWYGNSFRWSEKLVRQLRARCPETITIAGGPHANLYNGNGAILENSSFDLAVFSEGERTLAQIMECVRKGRDRAERLKLIRERDLPNLVFRKGTKIIKNRMEPPQPDAKPVPLYRGNIEGKVRIHTLVDGLGCDYNRCTFCPHKNIYLGYRKRNVQAICDEMEAMINTGTAIFRFASGDTPRVHALAIAREIQKRGLTVEFSMFHRAGRNAHRRMEQLVRDYRILVQAGLRAVFMGLETGNDRINTEVLGKNLTAEDVICSIRAIQKARDLEGKRCDIALSMIHPVPACGLASWDEVREQTLNAVCTAKPDSAMVTPPCAFPGTDWFDHPEKYGFHLGKDFTKRLMNYEYVLYKPTDMWSADEFALEGRDTREILKETMQLRSAFQDAGIPTDIGDENFLILQATEEDAEHFKRESLADILSCRYEYSNRLYKAVNEKSIRLSRLSRENRRKGEKSVPYSSISPEEIYI